MLRVNAIRIKIKAKSGCFDRNRFPIAFSIIDEYMKNHPDLNLNNHRYQLQRSTLRNNTEQEIELELSGHESGPELLIWIGTVVSLSAATINLITAVINAYVMGRKEGDKKYDNGNILLIVSNSFGNKKNEGKTIKEINGDKYVTSDAIKPFVDKAIQEIIDGKD
ncbi:MAG: hypothetical protein HPY53_15435 [Brevinematales bacterium]|nr:hypothetical protein [Brevinematales bacterium]